MGKAIEQGFFIHKFEAGNAHIRIMFTTSGSTFRKEVTDQRMKYR
jgi:hypothetical protein